ncbi:MAG: hypothetical protein JSS51_00605 [Planctomycetes bacterium]|nr:hypothetical protein [Planctomycetota bacterium]
MDAPLPKLADRYRIVREIAPGPAARRILVRDAERQSAHVVHLAPPESNTIIAEYIEIFRPLRIPHLAPIEDAVIDDGVVAFVTPYFGHTSGLITLEGLAAARGGRLEPEETESAADHILGLLDELHGRRLYNGPFDGTQVLVDRQGRVQVEQFGLARALSKGVRDARIALEGDIRLELRSIIEKLFRCLTGLDSKTMGVSPSQVRSSLDPMLDDWFAEGLRENGSFESAAAARAALPEKVRTGGVAPPTVLDSISGLLRRKP